MMYCEFILQVLQKIHSLYSSNTMQNELFGIISKHIHLDIVSELKKVKCNESLQMR